MAVASLRADLRELIASRLGAGRFLTSIPLAGARISDRYHHSHRGLHRLVTTRAVPPIQGASVDTVPARIPSATQWTRIVQLSPNGTRTARASTVSIQVVRGIALAVEQVGVPKSRLLRAAQLTAEELDVAERRILRSEFLRLCQLAIDLTGDSAFGLHWVEKLNADSYGPVSHLITYSPSLRQALESLCQFGLLLCDDPIHELLESDDAMTVRVLHLAGEPLPIQRVWAEVHMASVFRLAGFFGVHAALERVSFEYAAPAHHAEYARIFGPALCFEQPFTEIVFRSAQLTAPSPCKDEDLYDAIRPVAQRRTMRLLHRSPYTQRVREFLMQQARPYRTIMDTVARSFGLSARSLHRRLESEGTSYRAIERDALATRARHLLLDRHQTIQEIAYELGFSDAPTFHRAFKRWTGTTPTGFRQTD